MSARKLSPIELYYPGMKRWGQAFSRDMGELMEDYIGRQLATLPEGPLTVATVAPAA